MTLLPIVIAILLLGSALLAASETALFSLARMEHTRARLGEGVRQAVEKLMNRPLESLVIVIGLNETANVFAECLATSFLLQWIGPWGSYVSAPLMLVIVMLFCDITPKTFALGYPGLIAALTARPLAAISGLAHPIARWLTPADLSTRPAPVSESEFKALLRMSEHQGEVEPGERELIHKVFDFANRRVADVMTPRDQIFSLDVSTPAGQLIGEVAHAHFSRVPIYRGNPDYIVGILHAKDLVIRRLDNSMPRLERLIRPPRFVPPVKTLGELLEEMRRDRFQLALVVNEYGRLLGLITLEDLLEELFGEIRDEFEFDGPELQNLENGEWLVSGGIDVAELRKALNADGSLPAGGNARSLSSLVLRHLGRVPRTGDRFRLGSFEATVERVSGASVEQLRLKQWH
ncbi:MAG: HlyC/CorC family transporter [Candidatus Binataceae bacterium]|nr:HlyC/CorC family transporter [Candidatus Binataceae bacterium]